MITQNEREVILKNMTTLLDQYDYNYTLYALNSIIDEWAEQKSVLIEAFKKHPNYVAGKFLIAFTQDYTRTVDKDAAKRFYDWLVRVIIDTPKSELPEDILKQIRHPGDHLPDKLCNAVIHLQSEFGDIKLSKEYAEELKEAIPQIHPHAGQKLSRVVNKLCTYLNYHKHPDYNKEFAKFADALSPLTITRHTVLSINPLDYLTMSFGNSWASCHTIDKDNRRNMPNDYHGQYSSGTISYMLDSSSMILYTIDAEYDGTDYWTQPKINRQMFHYGEDKLVQGRLYPQDNDDDRAAYEPYRKIVQGIMSVIFDFPNFWSLQRGWSAASQFITSEGTHYRDYDNYDNCTLSKIKSIENDKHFIVGALPICVRCGERHETPENIDCCADKVRCADCGRIIREDNAYEIDGKYYCSDCVRYCTHCREYYAKKDMTYVENTHDYVCHDCLEKYYHVCAHCGKYHLKRESKLCVELEDYVCRACYKEHYRKDEDEQEQKTKFDAGSYRSVFSNWFEVPVYSTFSIDEEDI